jgi:RNA recognition motif-containing protein
MPKKVYIGGLEMDVTSDELKDVFEEFGEIIESRVIKDRYTKQSRGFAFITFKRDEDADTAIAEADGGELDGVPIRVREAKERKSR